MWSLLWLLNPPFQGTGLLSFPSIHKAHSNHNYLFQNAFITPKKTLEPIHSHSPFFPTFPAISNHQSTSAYIWLIWIIFLSHSSIEEHLVFMWTCIFHSLWYISRSSLIFLKLNLNIKFKVNMAMIYPFSSSLSCFPILRLKIFTFVLKNEINL